jgi:hypothetical protein
LGGAADTQETLIAQYQIDTQIKSGSTAQDHINLAEKNGLILFEYYKEGRWLKKRYRLPPEKTRFDGPD